MKCHTFGCKEEVTNEKFYLCKACHTKTWNYIYNRAAINDALQIANSDHEYRFPHLQLRDPIDEESDVTDEIYFE